MAKKELPKKIYIDTDDNSSDSIFYAYTENDKDDDVEYVRKDAFIEKACEWIKYNNENGGCLFDGWEEDFKKYMEERKDEQDD